VVDLRNRNREREPRFEPYPLGGTVDVVNVALMADLATVEQLLRDPTVDGMGGFYLEMVRREQAAIVEVVRIIARRCDRPVWFHCTSGKDRTGLVAALLLTLLGVAPEGIVADYACSVLDPVVVAHHMRHLRWRPEGIPSAQLRADADSMRSFLRQFAAAHGRVDDWLAAGGLEPEHLTRLRIELLDPA